MNELQKFQANTEKNNRILQLAIKEVDSTILVLALAGYNQTERELILRNCSERAAAMLEADIRKIRATVEQIQQAQNQFLQILENATRT